MGARALDNLYAAAAVSTRKSEKFSLSTLCFERKYRFLGVCVATVFTLKNNNSESSSSNNNSSSSSSSNSGGVNFISVVSFVYICRYTSFLFCCGCGGGDVTFSYCYVVFKYLFKKYINLHGLKFLCFCFSVVFLLFMTIN